MNLHSTQCKARKNYKQMNAFPSQMLMHDVLNRNIVTHLIFYLIKKICNSCTLMFRLTESQCDTGTLKHSIAKSCL